MSNQKVYQDFKEWLKQSWYGIPESEDLDDLIKTLYSPEDAALLNGFPFYPSFKSLDEIAALKGLETSELEPHMDRLGAKGIVWMESNGGKTYYALNDLFFSTYRTPFYTASENDYTKKVARIVNRFDFSGGLDPFAKARTKPLRALPIHQTVEETQQIRPYEDVVKVLDKVDYYSVSNCSCRVKKKLDPDYEDSKMPLEVCLHFDGLGRYLVENGMGREITRKETEAILKQAADAGLVHSLSDWEEKPDTL